MTEKNRNVQLVILAAGRGTRMRSVVPKVLHRLCGVTLLERTIRACASLKPCSICVVVGYGEDLVRKELARIEESEILGGIPLEVCVQAEQNGTGHAVQQALGSISETASHVLIVPGDVPLLNSETFSALFSRDELDELALLSFFPEDPAGFGRVVRNENGDVQAIVEDKDCSADLKEIEEVNSSIYLVSKQLLTEALPSLQSSNAQGELYLTDIVSYAVSIAKKVRAVVVENPLDVAGANTRAELSALEQVRRAEINQRWMENGVTMLDPNATYVDEDVKLGQDVILAPGVYLSGKTTVGDSVCIDGYSEIVDSEIGGACHIKLSSRIHQSFVGFGCAIGPFAHLRPGSRLKDEVKIGNFVESKKATFENGAKASHLSYIGDATVGSEANLGAGTITCNYDGVKKSQTLIGDGAFIGSNTALVAPVRVGKRAVIGAGSTITKDVPDDSLGISRATQKNIEDWVKARREK